MNMCAAQKQKFEIESDLKKNPADPRYTFGTPNKAKSDVWKQFRIVKFSGNPQNYAQCYKCKDILAYSGICGTGSLLRHKCVKRRNTKTEQKIEVLNKMLPENIKQEFIKAQINFVATDLRPPSIIEGEGFKELAQTLIQIGATYGNRNIEDILLTSQALTHTYIPDEYNKIKNKLENILLNNHLAFATDIWTDSSTQRSFLTLTTHYIDEDYVLKANVLGTREFLKDTQTGINIFVLVEEILKDFAADYKLVSSVIVTADESNVVAAFRDFKQLSCACHNLNLVMSEVLERGKIPELELLIEASKELVDYFKQADLNSKLSKSLKEHVKPCWSSLFNMLSSIYDMQQEIHQLLFERNELGNISSINLNLLKKIVDFLIPFQSCSEKLSSVINPTIHEYFLWYQKLINHCKVNPTDSEVILDLKISAAQALCTRFKPNKIHSLGLFLNPPYKRLQFLDETQREQIMETVKIMLEDAFKETEDQTLDDHSDNDIKKFDPDDDDADNIPSTSKKFRCNSFDEFKDQVDNNKRQTSKNIEKEIKSYLKLVVDKDYSDILTFWREATDLPLLRDLSRQILNIPASSATSEKVFSTTDRILEERRTKLLEENVDMLLFLNKNMK